MTETMSPPNQEMMEKMMEQAIRLMSYDYNTMSGHLIEGLISTADEETFDITLSACVLLVLLGGMRQAVMLDFERLVEASPTDAVRLQTAVKAVDDLLSNALRDITT